MGNIQKILLDLNHYNRQSIAYPHSLSEHGKL
jgi:hypothetical protein